MYTVIISIKDECDFTFQSKYCNAMDEAYLHGQATDGETVRVYKEDELIDQVHFYGVLGNGGQWQRGTIKSNEGD